MAETTLKKRELYLDITVKEHLLEEIFLYQVDFLKDDSFRSKEYLFKIEEKKEESPEEAEEQEEQVPISEQFLAQWEVLKNTEAPLVLYATDAKAAIKELFLPLQREHAQLQVLPENGETEPLHDCVSMGRVISMTAFDEEQYLSAGIRRRMKERYHEHVDEVKRECREHIFIEQLGETKVGFGLELFITDENYIVKSSTKMYKTANEEAFAFKMAEVLSAHPDADVITDRISRELFRLFLNMSSFINVRPVDVIFSLESMFAAAGKTMPEGNLIENYLTYIKNIEDMRFGRFLSEDAYSVHSFYLPVQISGDKEWRKQFEDNTVWKAEGKDAYSVTSDEEIKGRYLIKAGREQFVLKFKKISIQRYLRHYAMLHLEVENFCYPGELDLKRIHALASHLYVRGEGAPESMELKLKVGKQSYALAALPQEGNENSLWLSGLLMLDKKAKKKSSLVLTPVSTELYCRRAGDKTEEQVIQAALVRCGVLRKIEDSLAKVVRPKKKGHAYGSVTWQQKKQINALFELYRYLITSFGEAYEAGTKESRMLWAQVEEETGMAKVVARLREKFDLFFWQFG